MKNFNKINRAFMAKRKHFALLCAFLCASVMGWADYVDYISLTDLSTYSQDFNGIGGEDVTEADIDAAGAGTDDAGKRSVPQSTTLPNGWKVGSTTTARKNTTFAAASSTTTYVGGVSLPSNAKNGTWNFGDTEKTERAVGGITTNVDGGARTINVMARLQNNTGNDINSLAISYDIEKYRKGSLSAGFTVALYTSTNGSIWTSAGSPFSTAYSNDGTTAGAGTVPINSTNIDGLLKVSFPANEDLYLLWSISSTSGDAANNAQAFGIDNVSITPKTVASNELFATYQKQGDTFYRGNTTIDDGNPDGRDLDINYYIVSCGQTMLFRAKNPGGDINFGGASYETQLRVYNNLGESQTEIQACEVVNTHHHYTSSSCNLANQFSATTEDLQLHFFLSSDVEGGWRRNNTIYFNRVSINNPTADNTAPTITPSDVTMVDADGTLTFTFGDVTADDEYFYYVADKDHNIGNISLTNTVTITKPTVEDGTTYKFRCYAVDYNGNKSAYKEFTLVMPFNPAVDLALNKKASAGAVQNDNTADRAVNGNADNFWTCYGQGDASSTWWKVDLNNSYDVSSISIHFNDIYAAYNIYISNDDSNWTPIVEGANASGNETKSHTSINHSGRYLKVTSSDNRFGIREFNVYATGVAAADETAPTVSVTEISKTVNSVTLQIIASDEDDLGNAGTITAINISGDNEFVTQNNVSLNGDHQITLSGLTYNKTYHFTVQAVDLAGNDATEDIEVVLPFNTDYNLSQQGTATAGYHENENTKSAKAIDGDAGTKWNTWGVGSSEGGYANNWMRVDLKAVYNLSSVAFSFDWHYGNPVTNYAIEGSLDDSNWYMLAHVTDQSATSANLTVNGPARYVRFRAITEQSLGIYEFEVYASGFSTLTDNVPVITWAKVGTIDDSSAEIEIDAVDITTKPITTYVVSGIGEDPIEVTASEGKITLTSLSQCTHYTLSIHAKDESGNLSAAKEVELTTTGSVSGLYFFSDYFNWNNTAEAARFSTTAEPGVLSVTIQNMTADGHTYKLYNAGASRCTRGDCSGTTDHHFANATAKNVTFYATDEDHFVCTDDALYLCGTLVGEDQALVWNDAHTVATWSGTLDLSGTKQFNVVKKNVVGETTYTYTQDFYAEAQTFDGDYTYGTFTLDLTKMTGTWSYVGLSFGDDAADNASVIAANNDRIANVTINRNILADNTWYTLCLPFDMSAEKVNDVFGASTIATLISSEDRGSLIHLNFDYVNAIQAGKPYLIKPGTSFTSGSTISGVTIQNVNPSAEGYKAIATHMHFQGTFDKIMLTGEDKRYVSANNELYSPNPNGGSKIGAFRCYFTIPDGSSASAPGKQARIVFGPQNATGIDLINDSSKSNGKLLINGVLYIIRDGNTYNAQGMLVE